MATAILHESEDAKETREVRKAALRLNWRLWTIFQADLTTERSEVPEEIRINMLTLCKFVDKHTVGALANPSPEALTVLIDINRNIAAGLSQVPPSETGDTPPNQAGSPAEPSPGANRDAPPPDGTAMKIDTDA